MKFNPFIISSAAAVAVTCAISAAAYFYNTRQKEINKVMVFCKLQYNAYNCFDKLMSYLESAKKSIHVCMSSIQSPAIQDKLLQLMKEKNIKVRIVIDQDGYNFVTDFFIRELSEAGAEIKCRDKGTYNMHHKFCIVDDRILLTGTLDWGNDKSFDNWNYVYITTKSQLVEPVKVEFYEMWKNYTNITEVLLTDAMYESDDETAGFDSSEECTDDYEATIKALDIPDTMETCYTPALAIN